MNNKLWTEIEERLQLKAILDTEAAMGRPLFDQEVEMAIDQVTDEQVVEEYIATTYGLMPSGIKGKAHA